MIFMKPIILVHYGEIALKGLNRGQFEIQLVRNIEQALSGLKHGEVKRSDSVIKVELRDESNVAAISDRLKRVFGIEWFSFGYETEKEIEKIEEAALHYLASHKESVAFPIKMEATRSDKKFPLKSPEISMRVGKKLDAAGYETDLKQHKTTFHISILQKSAVVAFDWIKGPGGLPIGSSGKVLCLLSGGIDSPVATLQMMRRGCEIDLLHFYQFADAEQVKETKMMELLAVLRTHGFRGKLYLAPYSEFYKATFSSIPPKKELVLFRRFILKVATELAREIGALGLATGDNLAQVASQTLENLYVTDEAAQLPVYRPLIALDKKDIIELARQYGTYNASIKEYKDCCSLVAVKHPETKARLEDIKKHEEEAGIELVIKETKKKIQES
jgi:thiamine biosynthesis protein ThiI